MDIDDNDNDNVYDYDYGYDGDSHLNTIDNILARNVISNRSCETYNNVKKVNTNVGVPISSIISMITAPSNQLLDTTNATTTASNSTINNNIKKLQNDISSHLLSSSSSSSISPPPPYSSSSSSSPPSSWKDFPSCLPEDITVQYNQSGLRTIDHMFFSRGYPMGHTINIIGGVRSGKTQLVLAVAACNAVNGKRVLLIDVANGNFSRLDTMVKYYASFAVTDDNCDINTIKCDALNRIDVAKPFDPWELLQILTNITTTYDIIAVDGFSMLYLPYMNTSRGTALFSSGQHNNKPKEISSDNISIDHLVAETLIMLRALTTKGSTVIITNNVVGENQKSCGQQLRDLPDYLFNDMVDFIFTLESNYPDLENNSLITCILRPPWYHNDPQGNKNYITTGNIPLTEIGTSIV